jgi:hypothetical protein
MGDFHALADGRAVATPIHGLIASSIVYVT